MKIGDLSRRSGTSVRSLRYYEEQGLLRPVRRPSGYREYTDADVVVVARVRALLAAGLSTPLIAQVLHCFTDGGAGGTPIPTCAEMVTDLELARERITRCIDELVTSKELLSAIIDAGPVAEPAPAGQYS